MESSQVSEILQSLASIHQSNQQSLLELRQDQERCFFEILQAQAEDRLAIQSLLGQEKERAATPDHRSQLPPPTLLKMRAEDDAEAFLNLFERTAEIAGWPRDQWAARFLPLLSGESQLAAQQLPATNLLAYDDLKKSILQRVGRSPEQYRQLFWTLKLGKTDRPFAFSQRLQDVCRKWLLAGNCDITGVVDQVVLEQLIHRLPRGTAEWVQCHRPASLEEAVRLAFCGVPEGGRALPLSLPLPYVFPDLFPLPSSLSLCSLPRACSCPAEARSPATKASSVSHSSNSAQPLSPSGGSARRHRCERDAWAGLLELRRSGTLPGSVGCVSWSWERWSRSPTLCRLPLIGPERTGYR
ncbi:uncharacterized protein LOC127432366 [Myxocyprinus asiaticus]|uniref:uncharacterized protein LOC127432366 n=1 Tax=Myxocyprinus asiaticus TaxID=70543 RepID=UPI0022228EF6|nr:uncharacterized protein LOC127432366 [Myxocyprinus asiaticus]